VAAHPTITSCSVLALTLAGSLAIAGQTHQPRPFPVPADATARPDRTPLTIFPLRTVWTLPLNAALARPPSFGERRGYFPIEGDQLVAYDLATGTQLWIVTCHIEMEPTSGDDLVFTVEPEGLSARRATDGSAQWQLPLGDPLAVPLVWANGWLIAATRAGRILAFRASDGHLIWQRDLGSPAHARPAVDADRVYVPTDDHRVVALRVDTGEPAWEHRLGGSANDILPLGNRLYVGSTDNFFYCLNTRDGMVEWRWRTGADVIGLPAVDERTVYFVSLDNVLRGLDRSSGGQRWKRPLPLRPTTGPVKAADSLIVTGIAPTLRAFATRDGAPIGELVTTGDVAAPPYLFEDPQALGPVIVVVTRDVATGATVTAMARSLKPDISPFVSLPSPVTVETLPPDISPFVPLPNPVPVGTPSPGSVQTPSPDWEMPKPFGGYSDGLLAIDRPSSHQSRLWPQPQALKAFAPEYRLSRYGVTAKRSRCRWYKVTYAPSAVRPMYSNARPRSSKAPI
jgi:outer membrane protein assembly factor BamB